ncbi:putative U11/U12 small nuclear ribonucleoprotein 25kDa protein [Helianthus annuus]|uniref:U11/U12 small nuclear ribonucleoprotein 25kDa protein n=1 Tax=Helianthus annuus TaxID=4232 RepID=A0A9K3NBM1_HELAN|nr:putative U11/U12 small nuclear ribonucleoprotein 25kDa protein [Helianthus annuus]KAJ0537926.1 hypothetical protein HanHA300_Chr08g0269241 [Helianthus annuus]KAJ0545634.1 putative U11/U12 small nuclear ribonucleoprotein 25kDa protein [Helianthus annuus]KAJ0552513.1 hypothetical protein HanHA89_Chr08g0286081 [Helianthus annuus]KAJ0718209.1 hypothetical protein HanLR1_Chr08g0268111 [Helianthus annuus]
MSRKQRSIQHYLHSLMILCLPDVPKKPTLSDVDTLISLELGSAMHVSVLKILNYTIHLLVYQI